MGEFREMQENGQNIEKSRPDMTSRLFGEQRASDFQFRYEPIIASIIHFSLSLWNVTLPS
jgi:hypothetical protein